jgi:hypothetical protein
VSKKLFDACSADVKALAAQARREKRLKDRKKYWNENNPANLSSLQATKNRPR